MAEVIAHDIATLCAEAFKVDHPFHDELRSILLTIDDHAEKHGGEQILRGIRRAQIKLGTLYLCAGYQDLANEIQEDMKDDSPERLRALWEELNQITSRDFWEINSRGQNLNFFSTQQREMLPVFFQVFPGVQLWGNSEQKEVHRLGSLRKNTLEFQYS